MKKSIIIFMLIFPLLATSAGAKFQNRHRLPRPKVSLSGTVSPSPTISPSVGPGVSPSQDLEVLKWIL